MNKDTITILNKWVKNYQYDGTDLSAAEIDHFVNCLPTRMRIDVTTLNCQKDLYYALSNVARAMYGMGLYEYLNKLRDECKLDDNRGWYNQLVDKMDELGFQLEPGHFWSREFSVDDDVVFVKCGVDNGNTIEVVVRKQGSKHSYETPYRKNIYIPKIIDNGLDAFKPTIRSAVRSFWGVEVEDIR